MSDASPLARRFVAAVEAGDVEATRTLFEDEPEARRLVDEPLFSFGRRAVHLARETLPLLDLLLAQGADINAKSDWTEGGFGILDDIAPEKAPPLIERGAAIDVWASANLGRVDILARFLDETPALVHAKGGDGKRPLHFARTLEVAELLLERGAEFDALDDDHESTPAQHLVAQSPEVARFLLAHGARSDLLLATALGELDLVRRHLDEDPRSIRLRVSPAWFPMIDTAEKGGHVYQWTLGFYLSAFQVARKFEQPAALALLQERAGPRELLLDALWQGETETAGALLARHRDLVPGNDPEMSNQVADAARQNDLRALEAMLAAGFPLSATSQHGATPLHWACFHGNDAMVREILEHGPPLAAKDRDFGGTAIGWAIHGAKDTWPGISTGRHARCLELLLDAGLPAEPGWHPTGRADLDAVLERWPLDAR